MKSKNEVLSKNSEAKVEKDMVMRLRRRERRQLEFLKVFLLELEGSYRRRFIKKIGLEYERYNNELYAIGYLFSESEYNNVFLGEYEKFFDIDMSGFLSMFEVVEYTGREYKEEELEFAWECLRGLGREMIVDVLIIAIEQLEVVGFDLRDFEGVIEMSTMKIDGLSVIRESEDGSDNIMLEEVEEEKGDLEYLLEEIADDIDEEDVMEDYATMNDYDVDEEWEMEDLRNVEYSDDGVDRGINWGESFRRRVGLWKSKLPRLTIRMRSIEEVYEWDTFWDSMVLFCRAWWVRVFLLVGFIPGVIDMYPHYYNFCMKYIGQSYRMYNKYYYGVDYVMESFQDKVDIILLSCNVVYGSMVCWLVYVIFKFERFGTFFRNTMEFFGGGTYLIVLTMYVNHVLCENIVRKMDRELDGAWKSYIRKIVRNIEPYIPSRYRGWWSEKGAIGGEGLVSFLMMRWIPEREEKNELTARFNRGLGVKKFDIDWYEITGQHPLRSEMLRCKESYKRIKRKILGFVELPGGFTRSSEGESARDRYRWRLRQRYYYSRLKGNIVERERRFEERVGRQYNYYPDYYYMGGYIGNSIRFLDELEVYDKVVSPYYRKMVKFLSEVFVEEPIRLNELRDWYDAHKMVVPYYPWNEKLRRVWQKDMLVLKFNGERSIRYDYWYQENIVYPFFEEVNKLERIHLRLVGKRGRSKGYKEEFLDDLIRMGSPVVSDRPSMGRQYYPREKKLEELNSWKEFIADSFFAREYADVVKIIERKWLKMVGKYMVTKFDPYFLLDTRRRRNLYRWKNEIGYGPVRYGSKISRRGLQRERTQEIVENEDYFRARVLGKSGYTRGSGMEEVRVGTVVEDAVYGNAIRLMDKKLMKWLQYEGSEDRRREKEEGEMRIALCEQVVEKLKRHKMSNVITGYEIGGEVMHSLKGVGKMATSLKDKERVQKMYNRQVSIIQGEYRRKKVVIPEFFYIYNNFIDREIVKQEKIYKKEESEVKRSIGISMGRMMEKVKDWKEKEVGKKPEKRFESIVREWYSKVDEERSGELRNISMGLWAEEVMENVREFFSTPKFFDIKENTILTKEELILKYYMRRRMWWLRKAKKASYDILLVLLEREKRVSESKKTKEREMEWMRKLSEVMRMVDCEEAKLKEVSKGRMSPNEGPGVYYYNEFGREVDSIGKSRMRGIGRVGRFFLREDTWCDMLSDSEWKESFVIGMLRRSDYVKEVEKEEAEKRERVIKGLRGSNWEYGGGEKIVKSLESIRDRVFFDEVRMGLSRIKYELKEKAIVESLSSEGRRMLAKGLRKEGLDWVDTDGIYPWNRESVMMGDYSYRGGPYSVESGNQVARMGSGRKMEAWSFYMPRFKTWKKKRLGELDGMYDNKRFNRGFSQRRRHVLEKLRREEEVEWKAKNEWWQNHIKFKQEHMEEETIEIEVAAIGGTNDKISKRVNVGSSGSEKYEEKNGNVVRDGRIFPKMKQKRYDYYHMNNNVMSEYYTVGREYWMPSKLYLEDAITDVDKIDREIILYEFFRFIALRYEWPVEFIIVSAVNGYDMGVFLAVIF